jgi:alcohol dehydrogenase
MQGHRPSESADFCKESAMRAMVYRGPYRIRVEEKDIPPIEHPNDAIVRVTLAAICGSDLHLYHGMMPDTRVGTTFGHEFIGVVEEVGPSVQNLKRGDRVMVPFNVFCGSCFFCARGLYGNCHNVNPNATAVGAIYGYSHTCGGYDGGQSEYVRVPFADVGPTLIPEWMDDEDAVPCSPTPWPTATSGASSATSSRASGWWFSAPARWGCSRPSRLVDGRRRVIVIDHLEVPAEKARPSPHAETYNFTSTTTSSCT